MKLSLLLLFIIPLHAYSFTLTHPRSCVSAVVNTQERSDGTNPLNEITKLPAVTRNPRVLALLESCKTNPFLFLWLSEYMSNPQLEPAMHKALKDAYWKYEVSNKKATPVDKQLEVIQEATKIIEVKAFVLEESKNFNRLKKHLEASTKVSTLKHWLSFPSTVYRIWRFTKETYSSEYLDSNIFAFWGFGNLRDPSTGKTVKQYAQRPWVPTSPNKIFPEHVHATLSPREMAAIAKFAGETEAPIVFYSLASGRAFMHLLPSLAKFMGKSSETLIEQAQKAEGALTTSDVQSLVNGMDDWMRGHPGAPKVQREIVEKLKTWCESAWCEEERRHAGAFAQIVMRLIGEDVSAWENADIPTPPAQTHQDAIYHVYQRYASEIGATSAYTVMASHSQRELRQIIMNVLLDELKHLTIIGGVEKYLLGPKTNRLSQVLKVLKGYSGQHANDENGRTSTKEGEVSMRTYSEVVFAAIFSYYYMHKYLKTLPVQVLREIYEYDVPLAPTIRQELITARLDELKKNGDPYEIAAFTPEAQFTYAEAEVAKLEREVEESKQKRLRLEQWTPIARENALKSLNFSDTHKMNIAQVIELSLGSFKGAELSGSPQDLDIRSLIHKLKYSDVKDVFPDKAGFKREGLFMAELRSAILAELRLYQIQNNSIENARRDIEFLRNQKPIP